MAESFMRKREVAEMLAVSPTTLWRWERTDPTFPKARQLRGITGYLTSEITAYLRSRPVADETAGRERVRAALKARGIAAEGERGTPNASA